MLYLYPTLQLMITCIIGLSADILIAVWSIKCQRMMKSVPTKPKMTPSNVLLYVLFILKKYSVISNR